MMRAELIYTCEECGAELRRKIAPAAPTCARGADTEHGRPSGEGRTGETKAGVGAAQQLHCP